MVQDVIGNKVIVEGHEQEASHGQQAYLGEKAYVRGVYLDRIGELQFLLEMMDDGVFVNFPANACKADRS